MELFKKERTALEALADKLGENLKDISSAHSMGYIVLFKNGEVFSQFMCTEQPRGNIHVYNLNEFGWALDMRGGISMEFFKKQRTALEELADNLGENLKDISIAHSMGHIVLFKSGEEVAQFMCTEQPKGFIYVYNLNGFGWALDMRENYKN